MTPNSGAAKAGLKGGTAKVIVSGVSYRIGGDIITAVDGVSVGDSYNKLESAITAHKPGDKLSLTIYRGDKQMTVSVTLGNHA